MALHPEVLALLERTGGAVTFPPEVATDPAAAARYLAAARTTPTPIPPDQEPVADVYERALPSGRRVRVYRPANAGSRAPALTFFHGGGWVLGDLDMQDETCRRLANRTRCVVVNVDYRMAPEHRFPAALDDALEALAWVVATADDLKVDASRLAVGGMSAGGNLAAAATVAARDRGGPRLAAQLLIYPVLDSRMATASYREFADGPMLGAAQMRWYWEQYLGPDGDLTDPYASPAHGDHLAGLPAAVVVAAGCDPLRDEAEEYSARLHAAGVRVRLLQYPGQIHSFMRMLGVLSDADRAIDEVASAMSELLGTTTALSTGS